ncbi:MAG: carbonic anhydrase [Candidatus Odinarchaeota archaeon]
MEDSIKDILKGNYRYHLKISKELENINKNENIPKYPVLILTCMDPRINVNEIFQFNYGDVFVLRNAGNLYTLDVLRSIILAIVKFDIKYIIVLGHLDCGMTKINLNEFREKLPIKFLSSLTQNYHEHLLKIRNFFKPFLDEIKNIKEQIKSLELIKEFYPETEITGMLYDVNTGLVFEFDILKEYEDIESFKKDYKEILIQKKNRIIELLEESETEEPPIEDLNENIQYGELHEVDNCFISENNEKLKKVSKIEHADFKEKLKDSNLNIVPKISIPKIQFHGVKIYIPKISKEKKENQSLI